LIAPTFYPVHGGAGLRFYRYLPYFYGYDIETSIICGTPKLKKFTDEDHNADWLQYQDGVLVDEIISEKAKILKYKIPGSGAKQRSRVLLEKAIDFCSQQATRPDIIHIIAPMPFYVIGQLKKIKKLGVKLVYSHTIAKDFSNNAFLRLVQIWKIKQVYKQYDHILVQSNALKEIIKTISREAEITVIPNGVDVKKFSPIKNPQEKMQLRKSLALPVDATIITLVGAVHPRKGTHLLIEAWSLIVKEYPNLNLLLIGPRYDLQYSGLSNFKEKIQTLINSSNRESNIHLLGQKDQVDLYLKASDIFVFPSEREGMPNAVFEAMSSGLPVVLTSYLGLSEEQGVANEHYLLADRSVDSLRDNILKLINDQSLYNQLSASSRKWILNGMTIKQSAEQHARVFYSCTNS